MIKMKEILRILEDNAHATTEEIAAMTGIPLDEVEKTIKQAEAERTIVKYKTMINWDKLGDDQVWALIEVRTQPQREVGFDAIHIP